MNEPILNLTSPGIQKHKAKRNVARTVKTKCVSSNLPHKLISTRADNYVFHIPYSKKGFATKQDAKNGISRTPFYLSDRDTEMNISKFEYLIRDGHIFVSGNCSTTARNFTKKSFEYTNIIYFDIDNSTISLQNLMYWLENLDSDVVPTIAYNSYSCTDEIYKFRLVYIFNFDLGIRKRNKLYKYIKNSLLRIFSHGEIKFDPAMENCTQKVYSTSHDKLILGSRKIFAADFLDENPSLKMKEIINAISVEDFIKFKDGKITYSELLKSSAKSLHISYVDEETQTATIIVDDNTYSISIDDIADSVDFKNAMFYNSDIHINKGYAGCPQFKALVDEVSGNNALAPSKFIDKYKSVYEIITKTNLTKEDFGYETMMKTPIDYFDVTWLRLFKSGNVLRRKDGQRRRVHLSLMCKAYRMIKPSIQPDECFYNLMYERQFFIDNSVDKISNFELKEIVVKTFEPSLNDIQTEMCRYQHQYIICSDSERKSIGSVTGHKPTRKLTFDPNQIDWSKSCKENYISIKNSFPNLKETSFKSYYSVHKKEHLNT